MFLLTATAFGETPTGATNGVNTVFALSGAPFPNTLFLFVNGVFQTPLIDYALADAQLTLTVAPRSGDVLYAKGFR